MLIIKKISGAMPNKSENSYLLREKVILQPRISVAYKLGKFDQLNVAYGDYYQTPDKKLSYLYQP